MKADVFQFQTETLVCAKSINWNKKAGSSTRPP